MKPETKTRIAAEAEAAEFFSTLPNNIHGFALKKFFADTVDKFNYFSYEKNRRRLTAYFHEETGEYKVRAAVGLAEFCLTEFFTSDFSRFTKILGAELSRAIESLDAPVTDSLLIEQNFSDWDYGKNLPQNLEGFELFVAPDKPVKFTNGSYIVINYSDFARESDFTIFYNVYTENFTAESKIHLVPHVSSLFDAATLKELEAALTENLAAEIFRIKTFSAS